MNPNFNFMNQYGAQPIQNVTQQSQAMCFFVRTPNDLVRSDIMPNIFYLGINRDNKEIYVRRMNNDGNIEVETYQLSSGVEEKTDLKLIVERLDKIEKKLEGRNESVVQPVSQ